MILTVQELKAGLNLSDDLGTGDDAMLQRFIEASQNLIERQLGFKIETNFGGAGQEPIPTALIHSVALLAGHYYENREGSLVGVSAQSLPFGVEAIVTEFREWSF